MTYRKKLIEVALPLEAINEASAREKSIRHGHPSTLHLWWSRKPLATARAVIFASLVDDPDSPDALPAFVEACNKLPIGANVKANGDTPRMRLFDFIERLVTWEATTDDAILNTARELIQIATEGNPPPLLDPFAGGGSIPLEAQRLGMEAYASDLNPVAVMINKAQIEIPQRFANMPPVNPRDGEQIGKETWRGAAGLAADVRYYGQWMRDKAWERIGHLYPTYNGETVIAWIWVRTVKSPNPAVDVYVPLTNKFELSKKKGRRTWVEPIIDAHTKRVSFVVRREQDGDDPKTTQEGTVNRRGGRCIVTGVPIPFDYIRAEGKAGRLGVQLIAIVTEGKGNRNYYSPTEAHEKIATIPIPENAPDTDLPEQALGFRTQGYGMTKHRDLFTPRQLLSLTVFSDLVIEAREKAYQDALLSALPDDGVPLRDGGHGSRAYAEAVSVYLSFAIDKLAQRGNSLSSWQNVGDFVAHVFARQAIAMVWDFADPNPFSGSTGNFGDAIEWVAEAIESIFWDFGNASHSFTRATQEDAASSQLRDIRVISTDPPYYDNIGYADLSDFFYVWLRRMLREVYPETFGTMLVPKAPELVATPFRFDGSREAANRFFERGMIQAFTQIRAGVDNRFPVSVYYAFKQQESNEESNNGGDEVATHQNTHNERASTGWETMLSGLIESGFSIHGTWPVRSERGARTNSLGSNALASSIVLVCRPRPENAPTISRRGFVDTLRRELPTALKEMQSGNIAPVDLAQASIGPGMAIYSRYSKVLEADGSSMRVRAALGLINQELDAYLAEQDGDIDGDTRFAVSWFEQFGFNEGEFGQADVLARAKNTSVAGVEAANIVVAGRGKVRLLHWKEYDPGSWDPQQDKRPTVWEATHHLIERLNSHGETGSAMLMTKMPHDMAAEARNLAYRLYSICERKGWADHARDYNALVISWAGIGEETARLREAAESGQGTQQMPLFGEDS
jgi:putative DNA methylase